MRLSTYSKQCQCESCAVTLTKRSCSVSLFVSLESRSLGDPKELSEHERGALLDLPASQIEDVNPRRSSSLSRRELIAKAVTRPADLTGREVNLLEDQSWLDVSSSEMTTIATADEEAVGLCIGPLNMRDAANKRLDDARKPVYQDQEREAMKCAA